MLPSLFTYEQFGPFIIRFVLGITLVYFGYKKVVGRGDSSGSNSQTYGLTEVVVGIFLVIGLFTQFAALLNVAILIIKLGFKAKNKAFLSDGVNYYILLLAMALSLLVTGPGRFAFDLPL
jgi:putative oxidoreductase